MSPAPALVLKLPDDVEVSVHLYEGPWPEEVRPRDGWKLVVVPGGVLLHVHSSLLREEAS